MAVVAGKRKDGELKFLTNSAQLAKYTMDICGNEKCFPKRYRWCFIGKIVDVAIEVFVVAFRANKVYVEPGDMDAAMRRFNLQSESIEASYQLEALANLAYMMFGLEESRIEFWTKLINESRNKLRSWRKSDKERFIDPYDKNNGVTAMMQPPPNTGNANNVRNVNSDGSLNNNNANNGNGGVAPDCE